MITDKEVMVIIEELNIEGLLEFAPDSESFRLNEKGMEKGMEIINRLTPKDRLLVFSYTKQVICESDDSEEEGEINGI